MGLLSHEHRAALAAPTLTVEGLRATLAGIVEEVSTRGGRVKRLR